MHVKGKVRQLLYLFKVFISPNIRQISPKSLKVGKQYLILTQNLGKRERKFPTLQEDVLSLGAILFLFLE